MGSVEDDLAKVWFRHECTLIRGVGESPYGGSVGERVPFKGFVTQATQRVEDAAGQSLVTDTTVHCPLALEVEIGDQVELPEPFTGTWEITQRSAHDGAGNMTPNHQKLTLTVPDTSLDEPDDPYNTAPVEPENPYGGSPYG